MKMSTQQKIRLIEFSSFMGLRLMMLLDKKIDNVNFLEELNNYVDLNIIEEIIKNIYFTDVITSFRTEKITEEYKEIKQLYKCVIDETSKLFNDLGLKDPVEIFTAYVYMYRNGYLSHNKKFIYNTDMKDFSYLHGVDVIRGSGVCRSISSMLTDIYNNLNYNSHNLSVRTNSNSLNDIEDVSDTELLCTKKSTYFVKLVSIFTSIAPFPNHLITSVEYNGKNYVFDPTNDIYLYKKNNKFVVSSNEDAYMCNGRISNVLLSLIGYIKTNCNYINQLKQFKQPYISNEEYRIIYLNTLRLIRNNIDCLEHFYLKNEDLYQKLNFLSEKQNGVIKRICPFIPNIKK